MSMTDEDLAGLSDEERAALEDDDDESEILSKIAGDDDDEDKDHEEVADDDADDDADEAAAQVAPVEEFRPEMRYDAPEGLADKLAAIDASTAELVAKFQDGEIDMAGFMAEKSKLDAEKIQLTVSAEQAKFAERQNTDSRAQRWAWEQERFFANKANAETYKDGIVLAALDAQVKQLAGDPANSKRPAGWFLEEADRLVRERFGGAQKSPAAKSRQPDLSAVPKTLAQLPAADIAETGDGEFAYLDKLDGMALEKALSKMTPEQEARYLGAAA